LSGANWNNGANAGAFALNLNNDASNANSNIGGRLAIKVLPEVETLRGFFQCFLFGSYFLPYTKKRRTLTNRRVK
jgi:hypothetical protein